MAVYAQHGHAKADRLEIALEDGSITGVIFGARNETPEKLKSYIDSLGEKGTMLFDPQFYISTINPPNDRYLPEYSYYKAGLGPADFIGAKKLSSYCKKAIDFQMEIGADRIISPTVIFNSFENNWCQTALSLADASLDYHAGLNNAPPLLTSFVIGETALTPKKDVENFLDLVTAWDLEGVYLIFAREDSGYSQVFEPQRLAHALYMIHVLGHVNQFEVVNGFSDYCGLIFRSVGAAAFGTGWYQSLRQFHKSSFTKKTKGGGQVPKLRYSSIPLMSSIYLSELEQIRDIGELDSILSGVPLDENVHENSDDWSQRSSELQHWQALSEADHKLAKTFAKRMAHLQDSLISASALYQNLEESGVVFSATTSSLHLDGWQEAIERFKKLIGLN
jgi:hypothetical protein